MFPIIYKCSIYFPLHCHFSHWSSETGYECRGNIKPFHLNQHKVQDYFLLSQRVLSQSSCGLRVIHPGTIVKVAETAGGLLLLAVEFMPVGQTAEPSNTPVLLYIKDLSIVTLWDKIQNYSDFSK